VTIRIVKTVPAPMMDGFDVRGFRAGEMYDVDSRLGRYLVVAGYAVPVDDRADDRPVPKKR